MCIGIDKVKNYCNSHILTNFCLARQRNAVGAPDGEERGSVHVGHVL